MNKNTGIIIESDGKKVVIIDVIRFQSRRGIDWKQIEEYLQKYIGKSFVITEASEKIYIGSDFPDEFSHSKDTKELKGGNIKAKANIISVIDKLIQNATNKKEFPDYNNKHGSKAQYGWYQYETYFGIPVYDGKGTLERYNIFGAKMLVRRDKSRKLYLYDFVRIKKETSKPYEQ